MGLFDFVKTAAETAELHSNGALRTRYYKTGYRQVKEKILQYAALHKITVRNVNDTHGEIYLQTNSYHVMVSIIQVNPLETAVDLKSNTYGVLGFNKPIKLVLSIYEYLNEVLEFKGVSLHP